MNLAFLKINFKWKFDGKEYLNVKIQEISMYN